MYPKHVSVPVQLLMKHFIITLWNTYSNAVMRICPTMTTVDWVGGRDPLEQPTQTSHMTHQGTKVI